MLFLLIGFYLIGIILLFVFALWLIKTVVLAIVGNEDARETLLGSLLIVVVLAAAFFVIVQITKCLIGS